MCRLCMPFTFGIRCASARIHGCFCRHSLGFYIMLLGCLGVEYGRRDLL